MHVAQHPAAHQADVGSAPVQVWGAGTDSPPSALFYRLESGFLARFIGIADFVLAADGGAVECVPVPEAGRPWQPIYAQQVLPLLRSLRGEAVFHGGAVCRDGHAMAFLGPSGQGKSTLTAACAARGMPFLTDDCLVVTEGPCIQVLPDEDHVRMWADSYKALSGSAPRKDEDRSWGPKPRLEADPDVLPHHGHPAPLACMVVLDTEEGDEIRLRRLSPADAALAWVANAFVIDQRAEGVLRANLLRGATLAQAVPAYRLAYPRDYSRLPEVVACVSDCLRAAVSTNAE